MTLKFYQLPKGLDKVGDVSRGCEEGQGDS